MEKKIIKTTDSLLVYPRLVISYVVSVLVIAVGAPYWAYQLFRGK